MSTRPACGWVRVSGGLLRFDVESGPEFELELNDPVLDISSPHVVRWEPSAYMHNTWCGECNRLPVCGSPPWCRRAGNLLHGFHDQRLTTGQIVFSNRHAICSSRARVILLHLWLRRPPRPLARESQVAVRLRISDVQPRLFLWPQLLDRYWNREPTLRAAVDELARSRPAPGASVGWRAIHRPRYVSCRHPPVSHWLTADLPQYDLAPVNITSTERAPVP